MKSLFTNVNRQRKYTIGNWKRNCTIVESVGLIGTLLGYHDLAIRGVVVVCPPFTALAPVSKLVTDSCLWLGAQDISEFEKNDHTGDISASMLLEFGTTYVIIGHSERRIDRGETDPMVNAKAKAALVAGLSPVICVGEEENHRRDGLTEQVVGVQVKAALAGLPKEALQRILIAYEPIWAIGTGITPTPEVAQETLRAIRHLVAAIDSDAARTLPLLYGGSVTSTNAEGFLGQPDVDGLLVGGASLRAGDFIGIVAAT